MKHNKIVGFAGEDFAIDYLKKARYIIIDRNFRTSFGEIDIIAKDKELIVFIEVKTRKNSSYGLPYESVTKSKQQKIIKTALAYIKYKKLLEYQYRFDIIEVYLNEKRINHIEDAFWV